MLHTAGSACILMLRMIAFPLAQAFDHYSPDYSPQFTQNGFELLEALTQA